MPPEARRMRREGAEHDLAVHDRRPQSSERGEPPDAPGRDAGRQPPPPRDDRDPDQEGEEQLRDTPVDEGQRLAEEHDAQPADQTLERHQQDREEPEAADPATLVSETERR